MLEVLDLRKDRYKHLLENLFGIFLTSRNPERQVDDLRAVAFKQLLEAVILPTGNTLYKLYVRSSCGHRSLQKPVDYANQLVTGFCGSCHGFVKSDGKSEG
jgi:hypothetical protein